MVNSVFPRFWLFARLILSSHWLLLVFSFVLIGYWSFQSIKVRANNSTYLNNPNIALFGGNMQGRVLIFVVFLSQRFAFAILEKKLKDKT